VDLGAFYATPLLVADRLFIGNNLGQLYAINIDSGDILARYQVGRDIQSTPLIWHGQLIFGSRDGALHALKLIETSAQQTEKR
jgi:outer membrane protein assembly factor BamB